MDLIMQPARQIEYTDTYDNHAGGTRTLTLELDSRYAVNKAEFAALSDIQARRIISPKHIEARPELARLIERGFVRIRAGRLRLTSDGHLADHKFSAAFMKAAIRDREARTSTQAPGRAQ